MKVKRTAENQLNKDAYEADPDDRFAEVPDPGQGMTKASADVMQRRKIVKVSRYVPNDMSKIHTRYSIFKSCGICFNVVLCHGSFIC